MIHDNLVFFNVAEMMSVDGVAGLRLQRMPETVRSELDEGTAGVMLSPANSEIRFRIEDGKESATIRLSAELPTTAYVYHGPFQGPELTLDREPRDYIIKPHARLGQLSQDERAQFAYHPAVVRICFGGAYPEPVFWFR